MEKILYFVLGILFICLIYFVIKDKINSKLSTVEGFKQNQKVVVYNNKTLYDNFYSQVYDVLFLTESKNIFELEKIIHHTKMNKTSNVLDVGSGVGFHVNYLNKKGIPAIGMDVSKDMIKKATYEYPGNKFQYGDILKLLDIDLIEREDKFTHILMLYFTIYYIENKRLLFENCFNSLQKGGYMAIHLVDKNNFDPIINAGNPLKFVDIQSVAKKRITESVVKFKKFTYKAKFSLESNNIAKFTETFINEFNDKRINKHTLYMETQKSILSSAKSVGFRLKTQINLSGVNYKNQYIYILYKP
tara:strand:+ start:810 stop:1715 length:906 start_codon:yes stop_codon:yes gene_type:complete